MRQPGTALSGGYNVAAKLELGDLQWLYLAREVLSSYRNIRERLLASDDLRNGGEVLISNGVLKQQMSAIHHFTLLETLTAAAVVKC